MKKRNAFSLIEILVVTTIIGLLAAGAATSYSLLNKNSRDAKRKVDLEQIRSALEIYRSNNNYYPANLAIMVTPTVYLQSVPTDPQVGSSYQYTPLPVGCSNCSDYTLGAYMENPPSSVCSQAPQGQCKSGLACNYCVGPYGQR